MIRGHLDFAWVRELDGLRVAFVADIKKSVWTTPEGPDSLQLHAYGRAFAKKTDCDAYCTGIWAAKEGRWLWSTEIIHLDGPRARELWQRIAFAASNTGEASTGRHCDGCFARMHCPEYLLPGVVTDALAVAVGHHDPKATAELSLTSAEAARLLGWADRAEELAEAVKKNLREAVRRGQLVIEQDGKVWSPVEMPASSFTVNRQAHVQMRWKKADVAGGRRKIAHDVQWNGCFRGTNEDPRECGWCETCGREVYDNDGHGHRRTNNE